jgi:Carboxypeptidase regulatory-like domain
MARVTSGPHHRSSDMRAIVLLLAVAIQASSAGPASASVPDPLDAVIRHDLRFAASRLDAMLSVVPRTSYPSLTAPDGTWLTTAASAWTSGFFPGALWRIYEATGCRPWSIRAMDREAGLESQKLDTSSHDIGFKVFTSFGTAARLTGSETDRQVVVAAAASLASRYSATVGAIRSWDGPAPSHFRVIIDNLMNLELLFWASRHGGHRAWYRMAVNHALRTMNDHVRADGSTYHGVDYDPTTGAIKTRFTHQGAATESTWARGQAWGIYGFAMTYRETRDARFLATAGRVADWYLDHLPADHVPYWDFKAPGIPNEPRDSSAAAIAASGLLELAGLETDGVRADRYAQAAKDTLASLSTAAYLSEGTESRSILLHGTQNEPAGETDSGLIYGDYYFIEALLRYRSLTGRIADAATGQAVVGAIVSSDTGRTMTRVHGGYLLAGVPTGVQDITISAPGYEDATRLVTMPASGVAHLDVSLTPAATTTGPAAGRCRTAGAG